jgi:linoleoyl-CoA desaturase
MLGHHPYTNVLDVDENKKNCKAGNKQESDPDVFSSFPLMRFHPYHPQHWFHKYQHVYAPLLFALMTIAKVFMQDWEMLRDQRLYHINARCRYSEPSNVLRFYVMKLLSLMYMLAVPCAAHGLVRGVTLFVVGHMACGLLLATMFIVNHVIDGVAFVKRSTGLFTDATPMTYKNSLGITSDSTTDLL